MKYISPYLHRFEKNPIGRDFLCGDIHGNYHKLLNKLGGLRFNGDKDRLFCVGDLVDRGPSSIEATQWLKKPWFYSVRGNHDQAAINVAQGFREDDGSYAKHGGQWFLDQPPEVKAQVAVAFDKLPFAIELETEKGLVVLVHASIKGNTWAPTRELLAEPEVSRDRMKSIYYHLLKNRDRHEQNDTTPIDDVYALVVGHCQVERVHTLGNTVYLDTGISSRPGGFLTVMNVDDLPLGDQS